jgi:hypothetical protein
MPYALVFDLSIVYPNRHIRATTHGNGIYERSLVQNPIGIKYVNPEIPKEYKLYQNYPNPFNPKTKIKFSVPNFSNSKIVIYNIQGQEIAVLLNEQLKPNTYEVEFDGTNYPSGVYFYKIATENYADTKRMLLIK